MAYTSQDRYKIIKEVTVKGLVLNVILIFIKFLAGVLGRSSAMLADAVHSLSDVVSDVVVLFSASVASKPKDENHHFGHGKIETLASAFIGVMLFVAAAIILYSGVVDIINFGKGVLIHKPGMLAFYTAILSIITKEFIYRYTASKGKEINSNMLIANAWHHRSDAFSSAGTLLGIAGAIFLGENWRFLDPLAAIIVSAFIFKLSVKLIFDSIKELIETALPDEIQREIYSITAAVKGVIEPHNLKTRRIGNNIAIEMHVYVNESLSIVEAHDISSEIERNLKESFGPETFISVHVEPFLK